MSTPNLIADLAAAIVRTLPPSKRGWGEAALAERDAAARDGQSLQWNLGVLAMSLNAHLQNLFLPWTRRSGDPLPDRPASWAGLMLLVLPVWFAGGAILDASGLTPILFAPFEALLANPATRGPFNLASPLVLLSCVALAVWLNIWAVLRIDPPAETGTIRLTIALKPANLVLLAVAAGLGILFVGYGVVENLVG